MIMKCRYLCRYWVPWTALHTVYKHLPCCMLLVFITWHQSDRYRLMIMTVPSTQAPTPWTTSLKEHQTIWLISTRMYYVRLNITLAMSLWERLSTQSNPTPKQSDWRILLHIISFSLKITTESQSTHQSHSCHQDISRWEISYSKRKRSDSNKLQGRRDILQIPQCDSISFLLCYTWNNNIGTSTNDSNGYGTYIRDSRWPNFYIFTC